MSSENGLLAGKRVVVLGASRGVGREIVRHASAEGAEVLAVARQARGLAELAKQTQGINTFALDAALEGAPRKVFQRAKPDLLVICGGAIPPTRPLSELSWAEFGINWEVDAFFALVPSRVMPETGLGQAAVNGYARYLGVAAEKFIENMGPRQSPTDVAEAVLDIAVKPPAEPGSIFTISADGMAAAS